MLERLQRKGNPRALLVATRTGAATMANSTEVPQKKKKSCHMIQQSTPGHIYLDETTIQKDTCTPMFTAALFTIAKTWKQPECPSTDDWIQKTWCVHIQWSGDSDIK